MSKFDENVHCEEVFEGMTSEELAEYHDFLDSLEDDGQPSEYDEWQDFYGGDDWDHGQFDTIEW